MPRMLPTSERAREGLRDPIDGRLSSQSGRGEPVQPATRLIIGEGLEAEARDALGRKCYGHGGQSGGGCRSGVRGGRLRTPEVFADCAAPQVAGGFAPFRIQMNGHLNGNSEAQDDLAIAMLEFSAPDTEDAFRDESGRLLLPSMAESEMGERLWADCQEFAARVLNEHGTASLFVDGIAELIRPGHRREPAPAAWGLTDGGNKVFLSLTTGSEEDAETVSAFFKDMPAHGLNDPLLVVSDRAAGIIKASSARRRRYAHRMRNLSAKALDVRPGFKARDLAAGLVRSYHTSLPSAVACFQDDFEAMIAHLRLPVTHRRATRTTNPPERLFLEPAAEDHSRRVRRAGGAQADVRGHGQSRRSRARRQDRRVRAPSDGRFQGRTRPGIRGRERPQTKRLNRKPQARLSSASRT